MGQKFSRGRLFPALLQKDIKAVSEALRAGEDVNQPSSSLGIPVWMWAVKLYDTEKPAEWPECMRILELVVPEARGLMGPSSVVMGLGMYCNDLGLSREILTLRNADAASLVLLATIRESQGSARLDLADQFKGLGNASDPHAPARQEHRDNILAIHQRTSERLLNPATALEQSAASALSGADRTYWTTPLQFPDLAELPLPTQAFIDTVRHYGTSVGEMISFATAHMADPSATSAGVRSAFLMASIELLQHDADLGEMCQRGVIGLRQPKGTQGKTLS